MTRSELRQTGITILACALTAAILLFIQKRDNKKIAVVDAIKLFNSYKMKMELEAKAAGSLRYLGNQADSLQKELEGKSKVKDVPKAELEGLYKTYMQARGLLEREYEQSNQSINEQVWKRLNPLIDEYGKKEGLRLIIGANGMGNVLYNDDYYDQTKEVIDFANKKYEAGN
jgi:outer membrane protein